MKDNCQKIKLLKLYEYLKRESDEQNPLPTAELLAWLAEQGISCDRRTLTKDIEVLNGQGYEIMSRQMGHQKAYYVDDRSFSLPELKILMDAIQAAGFITEAKTAEFAAKIAELGGRHRAELLQRNTVRFNTRKHSNESIYYNVDVIERAILENCKVSFRYFDLDEDCNRVFRREGTLYTAEPVALILIDDFYYLHSYNPHYGSCTNYRVDRMDKLELCPTEPISEEAICARTGLGEYTEAVFHMFDGEVTELTLQFPRRLLGALYDKFGERNLAVRCEGEDSCRATVRVRISPTFWGWLFQFAGDLRIISPASAVRACTEALERIKEKTEALL